MGTCDHLAVKRTAVPRSRQESLAVLGCWIPSSGSSSCFYVVGLPAVDDNTAVHKRKNQSWEKRNHRKKEKNASFETHLILNILNHVVFAGEKKKIDATDSESHSLSQYDAVFNDPLCARMILYQSFCRRNGKRFHIPALSVGSGWFKTFLVKQRC